MAVGVSVIPLDSEAVVVFRNTHGDAAATGATILKLHYNTDMGDDTSYHSSRLEVRGWRMGKVKSYKEIGSIWQKRMELAVKIYKITEVTTFKRKIWIDKSDVM